MDPRKNHDLTQGSLTRGLLSLAGPMLVGAALQNVQSLIDLYWVGRLGSSAVAAIALGGTLMMVMFPVVMGMSAGTIAMVSRRTGEGRHDEAADVAVQSLGLALVMGLVCGVVGWMTTDWLCRLLGAPADIVPLASTYLRLLFAGTFAVFLLFIGNAILQATGNAMIPMLVMAMSNLINVVLDPILIFGWFGAPRLGIRGAAIATVLAEVAAAATVLTLLLSGRLTLHLRPARWRFRWPMVLQLIRIGVPGSGQMLARSLMSLVLMRIVAAFGAVAMAGYGIGMRCQMIMLMPAFALGNATATLVGQNLGAGQPTRAARAAWIAVGIDMAIMAACAVGMAFFASNLVSLFDHSPEVVTIGSAFLRITTPFYVFTAMAIVLGRGFQGAGDTMSPMILTVVVLWGLQVPLAIGMSHWLTPPTHGVWWAIAAAVSLHGVLTAAWFLTGRWKLRRV